ncbi:hypothetical protein H1R20_g6400, partial [Candolleomyces eurysporus]
MAVAVLVFVFVLTSYTRLYVAGTFASTIKNRQVEIPVPVSLQNLWGAYTPYFHAEHYKPPPHNCKINQIQRHGARFPTSGATTRILSAVKKLQSVPQTTLDQQLLFLKDYQYTLGVADLVPFGAYQSAESGAAVFERYRKLVSKGNIPFVRASGSTRVIDSATNWTAGFAEASSNAYQPKLTVILNESLNDTLEDAMCPNVGEPDEQTDIWANIFTPPIIDRLNSWAPGANLVPTDVISLISLCAFESVALEKLSPWCSLFTHQEFEQFGYWSDLEKYYNRGYGQPLGPVQGVGYINELLARLTGLPVRDNTQTNHTLTSSPITFPLDRTIYADFSHDNLMIAMYSAMGLFKQASGHLDPRKPNAERTWVASLLTPFSARMVVERMTCRGLPKRLDDATDVESSETSSRFIKKDTFVRVLVNNAVQPLEFCGGNQHGLCTLAAFVESQAYARNDGNGDFEKCYE